MNLAERSIIVYLLDAIIGAPDKCDRLMRIAEQRSSSNAYSAILDRIRLVMPFEDVLVSECQIIRGELK
jgi:hypothetical protein